MIKKIFLVKQTDKKKIEKIEQKSKGTRPEGMLELFCDLIQFGATESYDEGRIYYLAYLLSREDIKVKVTD